MDEFILLLVYATSVVIYSLFGGYFIGGAVTHFKKGEYFWFGANLLMTLPWIISIIESALRI